jgi:hypothetical protein
MLTRLSLNRGEEHERSIRYRLSTLAVVWLAR